MIEVAALAGLAGLAELAGQAGPAPAGHAGLAEPAELAGLDWGLPQRFLTNSNCPVRVPNEPETTSGPPRREPQKTMM